MKDFPSDPATLWKERPKEMSDELLVSMGKARMAAQEKPKKN